MKKDVVDVGSFLVIQKCTVAVRMVSYCSPGDTIDDYLCMAESTTIELMYQFCKAMEALFGPAYLRGPKEETTRIMSHNADRVFPGMLGSINRTY
jgi:hypothetical protein